MIALLIWMLQIYNFIILARVLLSYFPNVDRSNPIVQFLIQVTEPVLAPIREALQRQFGYQPFDFSPIVVFIGILFLTRILASLA
jgi:YggT family protein